MFDKLCVAYLWKIQYDSLWQAEAGSDLYWRLFCVDGYQAYASHSEDSF